MTWDEIIVLIQSAQTGDREAFGQLVDRFHPAVYAVALARLRNVNEALELTQEVFVHAMTRIDQLRNPHCFIGWLRQITVRMSINRLVRRAPFQNAEPKVLQNAPASAVTPLDEMVRDEQKEELLENLARLKPIDRATLTAFYLRGRSLKQMSLEFETPIGTIKRRLHTARQRLRVQMRRSNCGEMLATA